MDNMMENTPTVKVYIVENPAERYRKSFRFASQARAAMLKHGIEKCKIAYMRDGGWRVLGWLGVDGTKTTRKEEDSVQS